MSVSGNVLGTNVTFVYHNFEADEDSFGPEDYGDEIDFAVAYKWTKNLSVLLKYANYNADEFGVDTEKAWLQVLFSL